MAAGDKIDVDDKGGDKRPPRGERAPRRPAADKPKDKDKDTSGTPRRRTTQDKKVAESIAGTYVMFGGLITTAGMVRQDNGLMGTGTAFVERSEVLAEQWMELADSNPKVRDALRKFSEGSSMASLIAVHVVCVGPLLLDRGVLPGNLAPMFGVQTAPQNGHPGTPTE